MFVFHTSHPKIQEQRLQNSHLGSPDLLLSKFLQGCDEHLTGILNLVRKNKEWDGGERAQKQHQ